MEGFPTRILYRGIPFQLVSPTLRAVATFSVAAVEVASDATEAPFNECLKRACQAGSSLLCICSVHS